MNNDQEFNIEFVAVVEKYEELYNYNMEKYSNRQSQEKAWQNVANQVKSSAAECKKRWRLLRVTFLRSLREKKKPSGSSGKKKKPHYLEDAMAFLIPFTRSRCQTGNAESDDETFETESYSQVNDSEITNDDDGTHNSNDSQNIQNEQEEGMNTPPTIQEKAQNSATNEVDTQLPSKSTDDATRKNFQAPSTKKNRTKQPSTGSWENAAVQCLSDLSAKYKRKINDSTDEEDSDLFLLKSLLPDMKKLNDAQKRRYKQRILGIYDEIINEQCVPIPAYSPAISHYSSVSSASSRFHEANNEARNIYQTDSLSSYASLVSDAINSDSVHN